MEEMPMPARVVAVLTVLLTAAAGVLTNIVTSRWSWTVAVSLAVVIICLSALAWWPARRGRRPAIVQRARRNAEIDGGRLEASGDAGIDQRADHGGRILRSTLVAHDQDIVQSADGGLIRDNELEARGDRPPSPPDAAG
jgi:hypothetical protein